MAFTGKLHQYQEEALERFISRKSLLLAYGCGTGKTVISIAAAEELRNQHKITRILVLCPASLKYQWAEKIHEFTKYPREVVMIIDGDKKRREEQYAIMPLLSPVYVIAGYDCVISDYEHLWVISADMVICDEISAIKSFKAIRAKRVKKLFKAEYRFGLTATPIENRPEELYSIMQWVDDSVLGRYDLFERAYIQRNRRGWVTSYKNLDVMHSRMGDALARKTRFDPDVRPYLPDVDEGTWTVAMNPETLSVYKIIAKDMLDEQSKANFGDIDVAAMYGGFDETTPPGKLMAMYMCMEMLLDHPDLIVWSAKEYEKDSPYGSAYAYSLWQSGVLDTVTDSSKLQELQDHTSRILLDPDSKIIIFSKYKYMLDIMQDNLSYAGIKFTGDMSAKEKDQVIRVFLNDPNCRMLFSSHAGGYGLDLNKADYLVNYDLPWSFGAQDQMNSRHIRVSSDFSKVYIRNMITDGTVEERKLRTLNRKRQISDTVVDGHDVSSIPLDDDFLGDHLRNILTKGLDKRD